MKYPTRIYYTETDRAEMWDRWQKGESLNSIARLFGRSHSSIQGVLARTGGIRPPQRRRAPSTVSREVKRNGGRRQVPCLQGRSSRLGSSSPPQDL